MNQQHLRYVECLFYSAHLGIDFEFKNSSSSANGIDEVIVRSIDTTRFGVNEHIDKLAKTIVQRRRSSRIQQFIPTQLAENTSNPFTSYPNQLPPPPPNIPAPQQVKYH